MTSIDTHVEDLTEEGADSIIEQMRADSMTAQGCDPHEAEALEVAMAITERYGRWTETGFSPFLVRPIEVDAKAYALDNNVPPPAALRLVQKGIKQDVTETTDFHLFVDDQDVTRVVLNTSHVVDHLAPHIVAIYTPPDSSAYKRGSVAVAFLYHPTIHVTDDGTQMASWYSVSGYSGIVHEWSDYDEAVSDMMELAQAIKTIKAVSLQKARAEGDTVPEQDRPARVRKPRPRGY